MKTLQSIALIITIIGAINWALFGCFDYNLISALLGNNTIWARIAYGVVGVAGLINIGLLINICTDKH